MQALRGIDLAVRPGEVFGIIGRSGGGKSSLVRTINLLNRPTAGQVIVDGRELSSLPESELRAARRLQKPSFGGAGASPAARVHIPGPL